MRGPCAPRAPRPPRPGWGLQLLELQAQLTDEVLPTGLDERALRRRERILEHAEEEVVREVRLVDERPQRAATSRERSATRHVSDLTASSAARSRSSLHAHETTCSGGRVHGRVGRSPGGERRRGAHHEPERHARQEHPLRREERHGPELRHRHRVREAGRAPVRAGRHVPQRAPDRRRDQPAARAHHIGLRLRRHPGRRAGLPPGGPSRPHLRDLHLRHLRRRHVDLLPGGGSARLRRPQERRHRPERHVHRRDHRTRSRRGRSPSWSSPRARTT